MVFWTEDPHSPAPAWQRGRLAASQRAKPHPFCGSLAAVRTLLGVQGLKQILSLGLPATRSGPIPSPYLPHAWELDLETPPFLAPWLVQGVRLSPEQASQVLIDLPAREMPDSEERIYRLGEDFRYWSLVASLCLETLAVQKLIPVLAQASAEGGDWHARWMPVLDGPLDGARLAQLEAGMPPVCRAAAIHELPQPRDLLASFLNTLCDALARRWGKLGAPRFGRSKSDPAYRWIEALFTDNPTVLISPAQALALSESQRAWMRNLEAAGGSAFRIAFRLQSPKIQTRDKQSLPSEDSWKIDYLLQARDDPSLLVSAQEVWKTRGSALTQLKRRFEAPQEKLLAGLGYAARLFPPVGESLKEARPTHLALDTQAAYTFLREAAPLLEGAGFGLLAPPWWNKPGSRLGVRLRIRPGQDKGGGANPTGFMKLENLVEYRWELSVGETSLTEEEFRSLAALKSPLVQIRGQWVQLDPSQVEAAIHFWEKQSLEGQMSLLEAARLELDGEFLDSSLPVEGVIPEGWLAGWMERFKQPETLAELPQPSGLSGELRPYQRYGFSWMHFLSAVGLGSCLADDMGLGKTVQTIALLLKELEERGSLPGPSLLVCPTSVVTNWEREVSRFAPALSTMVHQGAGRLRGEAFVQAARGVDMVLTSYALARLDAETFQSMDWLYVILDEAQNIKNPASKQAQALRKLPANYRLALTGTPVENRLSELWSIMQFLNPGYLGSRESFRRKFATPIERHNDTEALGRLKQLVRPLILRRVKTDPNVIQDLPEKVENKVYCRLTEEQATLYEAVVRSSIQSIESEEGIQRRGLVLSMLMQLKQICNHPVQYLHQGGQAGAGGNGLSDRSGKLERLGEMLEEVLSDGDRCLIFTQFAEMGQILAGCLPQMTGSPVQYLHGGTPPKMRDQMVRRFQEDHHAPPIFILSLKAGGTGLNLTAANHIFHFDRWWNPAVEDQATDRAFRIGQVRNVLVHKFVTTGTLEEMIDDLIESKKDLARAVLGSGEGWLTELSTTELRELVQLRRD